MKPLLFLINIGLAAIVVYQGVVFYKSDIISVEAHIAKANPEGEIPEGNNILGPQKKSNNKNMVSTITRRNLFKATLDSHSVGKAQSDPKVKLKKTKLRLALWGTVEGDNESDCWAVIEDKSKRDQSLFKVGDQIHGAQIKEISRNKVILIVDGKDQVLEASVKASSTVFSKPSGKVNEHSPPPKFVKIAIKGEMEDPGALVRSMKARPYLKNGQPSGLLVYGIRPGSDIMALGLKNGDIIQAINGMDITNTNNLNTATESLDISQDIRISLSRRGQAQEVSFNGQTKAFTTQTAKD